MNREKLAQALDGLDESFIAEAVLYRSAKRSPAAERTRKMKNKRIIALAAAIAVAAAVGVTVIAARPFGIRDALPNAESEALIQTQNETAEGEDWSARLTESLCDGNTVMVTVTVSGGDRYLVAPTDASLGDSARSIGVDSDATIGEYAQSTGKEVLFVSANVNGANDDFGSVHGSLSFNNVSDSVIEILYTTDKSFSADSIDAICTVYASRNAAETPSRLEIPFTLTQGLTTEVGVFTPDNGSAVEGIQLGEATVTRSALGYSISIPAVLENDELITECRELSCTEGGFVGNSDGSYTLRLYNGQGELGDSFTMLIYNVETNELLGEITFSK